MKRADELAKSYPGKMHHVGFDDYIDHPDAIFIAEAPRDISALLAALDEADADRDRYKASAEALERAMAQLSMKYDACAETCRNYLDGCRGNDDLCRTWQFDESRFSEQEATK